VKHKVFIVSSSNNMALRIAREIQGRLQGRASDLIVKTWDDDEFVLGESLPKQVIEALNRSDFSICIFTPDDRTIVSGDEYRSVRDDVLFEAGLSFGRLGSGRVCILNVTRDDDAESLPTRVPPDLQGLVYLQVRVGDSCDLERALSNAINRIRNWISKAPPRGHDIAKPRVSVIINPKEYYNRAILDGMFEALINEIVEVHLFSDEGYSNFFNVMREATSASPRFLVVFPTSKEQSNEREIVVAVESLAINGGDAIFVDNAPDDYVRLDNCWVIRTNVAAGAKAIAEHVARVLERRMLRSVLLINGPVGNENANIRAQAVRNRLKDSFQWVGEIDQNDWREESTYHLLGRWLSEHTESPPDVIVCANDSMALGAVRAADEAFSSESLPLVFGYDGIPQTLALVRQTNSRFFATLVVGPRDIGGRLARMIIDISRGLQRERESVMPLGTDCISTK